MSRSCKKRKWESLLIKNSRKSERSVKSIQSQQSKKIEEVKQQMADFEKIVIEEEQNSVE